MKVIDLTIQRWQRLVFQYKETKAFKNMKGANRYNPIVFRTDNTMLSTSRFSGYCIVNGDEYTYVEARNPHEKLNKVEASMVVGILVRKDFLRWVKNKLKED